MKYLTKLYPLLSVLLFIGMIGCSNPADNVPEAKVSNPNQSAQQTGGLEKGKEYTFTADSKISFVGSKVTGSHDGGFNEFSGKFTVVGGSPEKSSGSIEIDINSMWSDNDRLTGHLKSPDFFDAEKFPTSTFTLSKVEKSDTNYTVSGELTMHGITKSISFPADIQISDDQVTLKAEFFIKRFDFGIEYPGRADDLIRDEVVIKLDMNAKPV
jgi:polyisoprenoid-binding protein YceI